jgi:hypothetical protein
MHRERDRQTDIDAILIDRLVTPIGVGVNQPI